MFENVLSKIKKIKADKWFVILLAGILLLVICIPTKTNRKTFGAGFNIDTFGTGSAKENGFSAEDTGMVSEDSVEEQLKQILEKIDGVGQVEVMITANPEYNQIEGVVVVAEGADIPQVRQEIIETAQALFPIAAYKVKVCKMTGGQP